MSGREVSWKGQCLDLKSAKVTTGSKTIRQQHELPPLTDLTDNLIKQSAYGMPNNLLRKNKSSSLAVKSRKLLGILVWKYEQS